MRRLPLFLVLLLALLCFGRTALAADDFLEPEAAFRVSARMVDSAHAEVRFDIAEGYYMYRERFAFSARGAQLGAAVLPAGKVKFDQTFGKQVETYRHAVAITVPVTASGPFTLTANSQGCADAGLCYSPMETTLQLDPAGAAPATTPAAASVSPATPAAGDDVTGIGAALAGGRLIAIVPLFLLLGLGLAFTPCVLPMVPILSSIIMGQSGKIDRKRGLALSGAYSLGMALVYTALGVAAGLAGEGLAASLQKPWVLGVFALLMVALSLSMFGVYELQVPSVLQSRLTSASSRQSGGRLAGVFVMGAISALIVGPCVAAPLAGALVYISQTRNVIIGGAALFSMAAGMSVPLLLVGVSAGSLLPKAGAWMTRVKSVFGVLLLAMAAWFASPLLASEKHDTRFQRIKTVAELDAALASAGSKPVMLDFYADWCVSCKEMEKLTFPDRAVHDKMSRAVLLQADVTANTPQDKALLKRFGLFGPPAIILFAQGKEAKRVIGYQDAATFSRSLAAID
ncbi:protein-disulfide reductase DsbD [Pseudoduganella sp. RAF53_2]|uniref:protein-disulfide reductase DsbD n=1 Tax=unclassified Pseudoduganella TaxID=2637179 RepID=UPI003F977562